MKERIFLFFKRVLACIIDTIICIAISELFSFAIKKSVAIIISVMGRTDFAIKVIIPIISLLNSAFPILFYLLYFSMFESSILKGTIGKKIFCLIVVDNKGRKLSFLRAFTRNISKILSGIIVYGYIMAAFSLKNQALHDLITSSIVQNNKESCKLLKPI